MSVEAKKYMKIAIGIGILLLIWFILLINYMWKDIQYIRGAIPYQSYNITDLSECSFSDCELNEENKLVITGDDPYVILDNKIMQGVAVRDITLKFGDSVKGFKVLRWYWNFGDGYSEKTTTRWDLTKKKGALSERIDQIVYGLRLDIESIDDENCTVDIREIIINSLNPSELKAHTFICAIQSLIAVILIIGVLFGAMYLRREKYGWIIIVRGIIMEAVYFMFLPVYQSDISNKIKAAMIILNVFLAVWIACLGVKKDEY